VIKIIFSSPESKSEISELGRKVKVANVASILGGDSNFPLIGTVTSLSEAVIRAENGGHLVRVYKKLGDSVVAGSLIAEFDNSGERAAVLSAEGAYEQAKAARDIAKLNSGQAGSSLNDAKAQAINTLSSAYTTVDDAIHGKTDQAFSDPEHEQAKFLLSIPDAALSASLETRRKDIEKTLKKREESIRSLSNSSDLVNELSLMQSELQGIKVYLDDMFSAYGKALPDNVFTQASIEQGKSNAQLARQNVSGAISSLVSAKSSLSAGLTANQVAGNIVITSQSAGTLATAEAQVKQALGAYNAALSRYEKTIIRSPITGTLNSLAIKTGDYINAFSQVAVVSNNGALEIISFVNEDDAKRITVGSPVTINAKIKGVITRVASAIDPSTRKIEVRIGITDTGTSLINGQSVSIVIGKEKKDQEEKNTIAESVSGPIVIPISALKLTPRGANVFSVSASNTLVVIPVKEGAILGDQIQILEGLTGNESIVLDARGLKEGQVVDVTE
jgi:multidrug resistance efflux pump